MRSTGTVILALFLILLGTYLLLNELSFGRLSWDQVWPIFPFGGGLALLADYMLGQRRDPGQVFLGTAATLVGVVFFYITLGPVTYRDLDVWWPAFILIGSVAFLAQWLAAGLRDWGALFLALVAFAVGGAGLAVTLQLLGPETRELLPRLWPVVLVLGGLMALLRGFLGVRSR